MLIALFPTLGTGAISGAGLSLRACSNETAMDFLPDRRKQAPRALALE
jgi:hypothetical protein